MKEYFSNIWTSLAIIAIGMKVFLKNSTHTTSLAITIFLLVLFDDFYAQGKLVEVYPNLPRVDYNGVYFFNPDTGFVVGENGTILKTTDGGKHWAQKSTTVNNTLQKIDAFSDNNIFICGLNGTLIHSSDLGETWNVVDLGISSHLIAIKAIDDQIGWLCGFDSTLFKTENGGFTWVKKSTGFLGHYRDIDFYNGSIGYICSTTGFLVTEDGGSTWVSKLYGGFNIVEPLNDITVLAGAPTGDIFYSEDQGTTWIKTMEPIQQNIQSIEMVNDSIGYATANNTSYYYTADGGRHWDWKAGKKIGNNQISFVNEDTGYGIGTDLTITKTIDGGKYWKRLLINEGMKAICFINEKDGFLTSEMAYSFENLHQLYHSSNGGNDWELYGDFESLSNKTLYSIFFIDSLNGFIGTSRDAIYKTTNTGKNWLLKDSVNLGKGWVKKFIFINSTGWALLGGNFIGSAIKKTSDGGNNWHLLYEFNTTELSSLFFLDSLNGWATGQSYFSKTTDGGISWIKDTSLNYSTFIDVYFNDLYHGLLNIDSNRTLKTTDGGLSWQLSNLMSGKFFIVDKNNLYLSSNKGLYHSSNSGIDWFLRIDSTNAKLLTTIPKVNVGWGIEFGTDIIYRYEDTVYIPVELINFEGNIEENKIILNWKTVTELNNKGFNLEKSYDKHTWFDIGFVEGKGTTSELNNYLFIDKELQSGTQFYRLRQLDYDGSVEYSNVIGVNSNWTNTPFLLYHNYPNPFNSSTIISYQLPKKDFVNISVYDIKGELCLNLFDGEKDRGTYKITLENIGLPSGVYFISMRTKSGFVAVNKLTLIK